MATTRTRTGANVWDRVWRHEPSHRKDDALLARERRGVRWGYVREFLLREFGSMENLRTIELGSGRGDLSVLLAEQGARVTLFDASDKALDQAARRFNRLGLEADHCTGDFMAPIAETRSQFDVSLSSGVIEHFKGGHRTRSIRAHYATLRPGGVAVISVPHALCPSYRMWKAYLEMRGWWPYGMEIPYSRRELTRRALQAGFSTVETRTMGFWQSVGDHFGRSLLGRGPDWSLRPSRFDSFMGMTLVAIARR